MASRGRPSRTAELIGLELGSLLQCSDMADWRQIQARIRKAKNSPEALAKLSELYQRTRDGMVAWEFGVIEEKAGRYDEAGNWYTIAAQRFRRADWKKKAEEALARLGIALPRSARRASRTDSPRVYPRIEIAPERPRNGRIVRSSCADAGSR